MNPRRWLHEHSLKLLAIRDTPEAIAGGVAIGLFFSLTPLFGLKTALTFFFAWLTRSNILAAVLASLSPEGMFTTFGYVHACWLPRARRFRDRLKNHFAEVKTSRTVWRNAPPAFVYRCRLAVEPPPTGHQFTVMAFP